MICDDNSFLKPSCCALSITKRGICWPNSPLALPSQILSASSHSTGEKERARPFQLLAGPTIYCVNHFLAPKAGHKFNIGKMYFVFSIFIDQANVSTSCVHVCVKSDEVRLEEKWHWTREDYGFKASHTNTAKQQLFLLLPIWHILLDGESTIKFWGVFSRVMFVP